MLLTILIVLISLVAVNILLLIFSCNNPDEEAIKPYRMRVRFPRRLEKSSSPVYSSLVADK